MAIIASSGYQSQSCIARSMTLAKPLSLSLHLSFPCQENASKPRTEVHGERTTQDQHESDCDPSLLGASVKPQPKDKDKESPSGFLYKALHGPVSRAVQPHWSLTSHSFLYPLHFHLPGRHRHHVSTQSAPTLPGAFLKCPLLSETHLHSSFCKL